MSEANEASPVERVVKCFSIGQAWKDLYTIGFSVACDKDGTWCFMIHITKWVIIIGPHYRGI